MFVKNRQRSFTFGMFLTVFLIFMYLCFINFAVYNSIGDFKFGIDDAHIFFAYAENFRNGLGFRYSSDIPTTEGFSSPLWMLISVVSFVLRLDEIGVLIFSLFIQAMIVFIFGQILRIYFNKAEFRYIYSFWLVSMLLFPSFWIWNGISLMENPLVTFWQLATLLICVKGIERKATDLVFFLSAFVRIEVFALSLANILLTLLFSNDKSSRLRSIRYFISLMLGLSCITIWRILAYGHPLPNTYYAKVSPDLGYRISQGFSYVSDFIRTDLSESLFEIILVGLFSYLVALGESNLSFARTIRQRFGGATETSDEDVFTRRNVDRQASIKSREKGAKWELLVYCGGNFAVTSMLAVAKGGDHFKEFRLFSSSVPFQVLGLILFGFILAQKSMRFFTIYVSRRTLLNIVVLFIMIPTFLFGNNPVSNLQIVAEGIKTKLNSKSLLVDEFQIAKEASIYKVLEEIRLRHDPEFAIGIITGGVAGRNYKGKIYDLTGLNYEPIAHNKGSRVGFFGHSALEFSDFDELSIDFIPDSRPGGIDFFLRGLTRQEMFYRNYSFGELCATPQGCVTGYLSKKWTLLPFTEQATFNENFASWQSFDSQQVLTNPEQSKCKALADSLIGVVSGRKLFTEEPLSVVSNIEITDRSEVDRLFTREFTDYLCSGYILFPNGKSSPILFYSAEGLIKFKLPEKDWQT